MNEKKITQDDFDYDNLRQYSYKFILKLLLSLQCKYIMIDVGI